VDIVGDEQEADVLFLLSFANAFLCYAIYFWMKEKRDVKKLRKEREKPKSLKC
jgi:hypothetical protein